MVQGTMSSVAEITKNMKRFNKCVNTINITAACLRFKHSFLRLKSNAFKYKDDILPNVQVLRTVRHSAE